ncbi:hypothetical protein DPMN_056913 [Dreissena polymorpha]|uniref:Uncharacterized protein n=1 Tax=Dreissena polymorpha TaxID=45954 RepID=A0A9D4CVC4_DREPO|nr:hypothetical protein DPMN_056913 [Dreissena polymorpha]
MTNLHASNTNGKNTFVTSVAMTKPHASNTTCKNTFLTCGGDQPTCFQYYWQYYLGNLLP